MKIVLVVQARTGSTRLPGKVLLPIAGQPVLAWMIRRLRAAHSDFQLVVATTDEARDRPIVDLCQELGVACFTGHPTDCLDRHFRAGEAYGADWVVKVPSDCPLVDPRAIDRVLGFVREDFDHYDLFTNLLPPTWPDGNDIEVMSMSALYAAWREATAPFEREHTTPFIWERPGRFRIANIVWDAGPDCSHSHRLTLDYPEDFAVIGAVFEGFLAEGRIDFSALDVVRWLDARPKVRDLNARHRGACWQWSELGHLSTLQDRSGVLCWSGARP
ncbi:MAG: glycosyltransferase family protein [Polyangiaceae bacterium]|nr:glycosyltransferase family protein [Polyangiaceae bacterium]